MASEEIATLITEAAPYLTAALTAYGSAVLSKAQDDAADATVSLGRRLLQRIFGHKECNDPLPVPIADVVHHPGDPDALGALRLAIRKELETDAKMLADFRATLVSGQIISHAPTIRSGRDTYYSARDMTITRPAE